MMDRAAPPNRLPRRAGSGRFPIRVSTSTGIPSLESESSTTSFASASSSQRHTPPAPTRAHHHRFDSQHFSPTPPTPQLPQTAISATTRPSLTPLATGNERLRSNSEGPTPGIRIKRMGMVSRKMSELGTVDEARSSRFSHYRGLSHGSVMQDKHPNGVGPNPDGSSSPVSPAEHDRRRGHFVRRLSSLPEHKRDSSSPDKTVEGVKGVLYSLALVQPYISSLVGVVREGSSKRSSLERVFYNASTHIEQLDRQLQGRIVAGEPEDEDENEDDDESDLVAARSTEGIRRTCLTCVMAYQHVGAQLLRHARQLVLDGDARYVRTLALLVYGGLLELRNACVNLAAEYGDEAGSASPPGHLDRSITPTPHHPRPGGHPRGDVGVGRSLGVAVPTYVPGPPPSTRSNGSVRTGSLSSGTVMATPRSGESFPIPSTPMDFHSRTNTMQSLDETRDDRQFEKIYLKLSQADEIALRTVPTVKQQFVRCIEVCQKQETEKELRAMWTTLDSKCSFIIQLAELLKIKLSGIKLKEPGVWHDREFWQLCSTFVKVGAPSSPSPLPPPLYDRARSSEEKMPDAVDRRLWRRPCSSRTPRAWSSSRRTSSTSSGRRPRPSRSWDCSSRPRPGSTWRPPSPPSTITVGRRRPPSACCRSAFPWAPAREVRRGMRFTIRARTSART